MEAIGRVALVIGWLAGINWLSDLVNPGPAGFCAVVLSGVLVGLLVNRWWAVAVLWSLVVAFSIWALASQTEEQEVAGVLLVWFAVVIAAGLSLALLFGVWLRRMWERPGDPTASLDA